MKTAREWFETFPEPYKSQAIANLKWYKSRKYGSAADALGLAFPWSETHEGHEGSEYWAQFHETITKTK